jgi:hypothetical protein
MLLTRLMLVFLGIATTFVVGAPVVESDEFNGGKSRYLVFVRR